MKLHSAIAVLIYALLTGISHGAVISYTLSGLGQVSDPGNLVGGSSVGSEAFVGAISYDTNAASTGGSPVPPPDSGVVATYAMAPAGPFHVSLSFRGMQITTDPDEALNLTVQNLLPTNPGNKTDSFNLNSAFPLSPAIAPSAFNILIVTFLDSSGLAFGADDVSIPVDLADFGSIFVDLQIRAPTSEILWSFSGQVTSLAAAVPLPGSLWLVLIALTILSFHAVARRRSGSLVVQHGRNYLVD